MIAKRDDYVHQRFDRRRGLSIELMNQVCNRSGRGLILYVTSAELVLDDLSILDEKNRVIYDTVKPGAHFHTYVDILALSISNSLPKINNRNKIPHFMKSKFSWLDGIDYEWTDTIPLKYDVCPIAGLSPDIADLVKRVGVSIGGDNNALKISSIFRTVTSDFKFPDTITAEAIYNELTSPGIAGNVRRMTDVLIAMGAETSKASIVATSLNNLISKFVFLKKTSSFSTRDQIIGHLDLSRNRYSELVSVPNFNNDSITRTLETLGFLLIVLNGGRHIDGYTKKISLMVDGSKFTAIINSLKSKFASRIVFDGYPARFIRN
jgi:hypothetical protein